jgi:ABC-type bacteriocin/lantibiotic exporter with double-glycine peptidase domain
VKEILKNTWTILTKKERRRFSILILFDIIISIIDILSLALLLWIIKFYIEPGRTSLDFLPGWLTNKNSILFIAVFFFLFGVKNMAAFLIAKAGYRFIGGVAVRISRNNLVNYQEAEFGEFINVDSSVHIRRIGYQPFEFCQYMLSGIQQIITQSFLILLTIIAILLFNAKLFLLLLIILLPPVIVVFYFIKKRLSAARSHIRSSNERSFQYLLDALKGYVEANIYNRSHFFLQRFINYRKKFSLHLFDSISLQNMPGRIIEIFAVMGLFILIAIAKWTGNNDSSALITIGAFMAAAYKIIPGIVKLINASGQMRAYEFSINDLVQPGIKEKKENERLSHRIGSVDFKKISFQYPKLPVLDNFNLAVKKGDFVGISGESGKGKTTVFNLLLGFLAPSSGEIFFNDISVNKDEIKKYWPSISYVRQQSFFIYDTILRNITLEEDGHNQENLQLALKISGVDELIEKFPGGLDHVITENGKNISGGQQQRIALARAVYKNADLVLLDEPFNELDEGSEIMLLEHFRALCGDGKLVIMITHDKKSLSYCNKIISLDEQ